MGSGARGMFALMIGGNNELNHPVGTYKSKQEWASSVPVLDMPSSAVNGGAANLFYHKMGYNFGLPKVGYVSLNDDTWDSDVRAVTLITSGMDNPNTPSALFIMDYFGKRYDNKTVGYSSD